MKRLLVPVAVVALVSCGKAPATVIDTTAPTTTVVVPPAADPTAGIDDATWRATSTTQRASRSRTRPTAPPRPVVSASGDVWAALAQCESGMQQDVVGEGVHYSYFQWKLATWRSVKAAGDPADPRDASYEAQVAAAKRLQARYGWGQWPSCSRKLGLR